MRLAISGTAAQGKSTLLKSFLDNWSMYKTPETSYRSLIKPGSHSKQTNKDTQWSILNHMLDEIEKTDKEDNIIFDRCPLDNLVYSMWACHKNVGDIDDAFVEKCIPIVKESMKFLDIIFIIPITNVSPGDIEDDGTRETDSEYINEIDNFFKALYNNWNSDDTRFFPKEDRSALIEIFGTTEERVKMLELYITPDGGMYGDEDTLVDTNMMFDEFGYPLLADDQFEDSDNKTYK